MYKRQVKALIRKHRVEIIAIGNGTASKETEIFAAQVISELDRPVSYMAVSYTHLGCGGVGLGAQVRAGLGGNRGRTVNAGQHQAHLGLGPVSYTHLFGSRYRMVDFSLSAMVNAGIENVTLLAKKNYYSLMDHLGNGREWDPVSYTHLDVYKRQP